MEGQFQFRVGDSIIVIIYFVLMLIQGLWTTRKIKRTEDYFVGGRKMPSWAVGLSMLGTAISSVTFLAYPGSAYEGNWSRLAQGLMLPFAALLGITFFVAFYRKSLFVSAYQYFGKRFGGWSQSYTSIIYIWAQIFRMGAVTFLLTFPIQVVTGWNPVTTIIVMSIIITIYTVLGGMKAVVWTDVSQTILLILGGIVTIIVIFVKVPGGLVEVISTAAAARKLDISTSWSFDLTRDTFWIFALSGLIGCTQEFSTDQIYLQRYAAASTIGGARWATVTVGFGCIPVWCLFMFIGSCLWVFYQAFPGALPVGIRPDQIFPHFMLTQLPVGLGGFVIAALLAAAMSTISSLLNATATVVTVDWYKRFFIKDRDDEYYLKLARIITILSGGLVIVIAWAISKIPMRTFLDIGFFLGAVFSGGLGGLFLLGFFFKRANSKGALVGVIAAVLVILWLTSSHLKMLPQSISSSIHPFIINVFGNITVLIVGYLASYFWPAPTEAKLKQATWWTRNE